MNHPALAEQHGLCKLHALLRTPLDVLRDMDHRANYKKTGESTDDTVNWSPPALLSFWAIRAVFLFLVNIRPTPLISGGTKTYINS